MFALTSTIRLAHPLVKPLVYSAIHGMRSTPFCTKSAAEVQKKQREFEELGNKVDSRFNEVQEQLKKLQDQVQKQNELVARNSQGQNDFFLNVDKGIRDFNRTFKEIGNNLVEVKSDNQKKFLNNDMKFIFTASILLSLFFSNTMGRKNEEEAKTETKAEKISPESLP